MRFIEEFRDRELAQSLCQLIAEAARRPWTIMEVCGGQTHTIMRFGIDQLLPPNVTLVHGPGCPVCVTPTELIDTAIAIAMTPGVIFCSFGDMLRVPGTQGDLLSAKAQGAQVRVVYSPLDCLAHAQQNPTCEVVFFAVGFETTAPANAMAVLQAQKLGLKNFSILPAGVLVPPAMEKILASPECKIQAFLAAGHVCTVTGFEHYESLAQKYHVPIVVTGFEPVDILQGIYLAIRQLEEGRADVENQYARSVRRRGNQAAQAAIERVFEVVPRRWRGLGTIPSSGLALREEYAAFDASRKFACQLPAAGDSEGCIAGLVLQGIKKPLECPAFATSCTPERPLGAPMVSSEGACAAYYRYRRQNKLPAQSAEQG